MEYLDKVLGVKVTYDDVEFKHLPNFIATRSVSYTHLDVYKRQQSGKESVSHWKGCDPACTGKLGSRDQAERPADQGQIFAPPLGQPHSGGD